MMTVDRVEKWKALSTHDDGEKKGAIVPFGLDPDHPDGAHAVQADEDWMAAQRPGYVDPTEDLTDDDLKKIQ